MAYRLHFIVIPAKILKTIFIYIKNCYRIGLLVRKIQILYFKHQLVEFLGEFQNCFDNFLWEFLILLSHNPLFTLEILENFLNLKHPLIDLRNFYVCKLIYLVSTKFYLNLLSCFPILLQNKFLYTNSDLYSLKLVLNPSDLGNLVN